MAQATASDVHVDSALTNLSIAYLQKTENYVADKVFAPVPVNFKTDEFFIFDKNDLLRDDSVGVVADGTEAPGSQAGISTDTYKCIVRKNAYDIGDQLRANADPAVDIEQSALNIVTTRMLIKRESIFASSFFTTGKWATDVTGTAGVPVAGTSFKFWDDYANSDPSSDIEEGKKKILQQTGQMPNKLVVGYEVHQKLKNHPLIKDQFKYTSRDSLTAEMLKQYFEVDDYLVAKSIRATNVEGATGTYDFTLGKNALLAFANPTPGLMMPSAGYMFVWNGLTGMSDLGVRILRFDGEQMRMRSAIRIQGEYAWDMKITGADLGYFFSGAVS